MIARGAVQASKQSNKQVGDGTTATVILSYHLYRAARRMIGAGINRMVVERKLNNLVDEVTKYVEQNSVAATPEILRAVARVSCGDKAMGELIAQVLADIGADGGITVEDYAGDGVYPEVVDGFYWAKGYTSIQLINNPAKLESRFQDVAVLITEKRLATTPDIAPILDKIVGAGITDLVIVGEVDQEALSVLAAVRSQGLLTATPVDIAAFGGARSLMLDDLALVTGGQSLLPGVPAKDFQVGWLGTASKVIIGPNSTTIIGGEGEAEDIQSRVQELETQLDEATTPSDKEAIRGRLGRLRGKVAIMHVGGASDIEQRETKLRVQDAVCAVQAAGRGGVMPGGGVALALAPVTEFKDALEAPFKDLMANAGYNAEAQISQLDSNKLWKGFDVTTTVLTPVDLLKVGIVDPAPVVTETVRNAVSVVGKIIIGSVGITYEDREAIRG
jgi:chaperonin GroEL